MLPRVSLTRHRATMRRHEMLRHARFADGADTDDTTIALLLMITMR